MEVIKAEQVDNLILDDTLYQFTVELMDVKKVLVSVFNTHTGITYKTIITIDDKWYTSNIYIFRGIFNNVFKILTDSLIENKETLPHTEVEENKNLQITINYADDIYPFELKLDIQKHVSENGELDDRINSLEYQVRILKEMLYKKVVKKSSDNKIYNEVGNLIYEGEMKDGKRHGKGIVYCPNTGNKLVDAEFKDGYYDGNVIKYEYSWNGKEEISEKGIYKNGQRNGRIEGYNINKEYTGTYWQTNTMYTNSVMNGIYEQYDQDGGVVTKCNYIMGVKQ